MQTIEELKRLQALPLETKIVMTKQRIMQWVEHYGINGVYISFSGGKDSTVLLHIARQIYPNIKAVFVDVPTQFPELRTFAERFDNVDIIRPKISFMEVCDKYGFPLISKEVSECVSGARKYLTRLRDSGTVLTDRQTDRQTEPPYRYWFERVTGQGKYKRKASSPSRKPLYQFEWNKLNGLGKYSGGYDGGQQYDAPERVQNLLGWRGKGALHPQCANGYDSGSVRDGLEQEESGDYP